MNHVASANGDGIHQAKSVHKFLLGMYLVLGAATVLSIVWGCLLEGPMFYYISLFNFALYYGFLLIFAIVAACWIEQLLSSSLSCAENWRSRAHFLGPIFIALVACASFAYEARRFRTNPPDQTQQRLFAASIEGALRIDPAQPKFLNFEGEAWAEAVGVALYLERRGTFWMVREDWPMIFGRDKVITEKRPRPPMPTPSSSFWRIVSSKNSSSLLASDRRLHVLPLSNSIDLVIQPALESGSQIEK